YGLVAARDPPGFTSLYGPQGAGGSTNIPDGWHDLRLAGARARWLLIQTAARVWETPPDRLTTREAHVVHPDGRTLGYAALAPRAAKLDLPAADLPLKARSEYRIIGQPTRVVDARDIVTGVAAYGIDAAIPSALTALIARCPYFVGEAASVDEAQARRVPGVRQVVRIPGPRPGAPLDRNLAAGVAVLADDFWSARKGREALRITWTRPSGAADSSAALERRATAALAASGKIARRDGNPAEARKAAAGRRRLRPPAAERLRGGSGAGGAGGRDAGESHVDARGRPAERFLPAVRSASAPGVPRCPGSPHQLGASRGRDTAQVPCRRH